MTELLPPQDSESKPTLDRLAFLEAVRAASPTMVALLDSETGTYDYIDPSVGEYLGYTAEEVIQSGPLFLASLLHPDDWKASPGAAEALPFAGWNPSQGEGVLDAGELRLKHRDGRWRWFHARRAVFDWQADGRPRRVLSIFEDIGERKAAEAALRESLGAYREASDLLPQAVFEMDATGRLTFINRQGFLTFGYTAVDFQRGLQALEMLVPGDRVRAAQNISRAMAGEAFGHEYEALRKDGGTFPVIIHSAPVLREGRPVGLRGIVVDLTERKHAEEEKDLLQDRLRYSEKMEAIGQLAGGMAHDFNNHLSAIMGFAEILLARLEDPELLRFAEGIITSSKRSAELTRQLLTFARKGKFLTVLVDLEDVIEEVLQILRHTLDRRILLKRLSDSRPALVLGDPYELQNALMNLALNARDAMPEGGELTFSTEVRELDERTCRSLSPDIFPGTFLQLSVTDTGVGIAKELQPRIFEPFFSTKEPGKATGLGLASVYGTMKHHRGAVLVYSEPGRGSCFKLFLPLVELEEGDTGGAQEARRELQSLGLPPDSKQVLVIEDEELVGQMLLVMLRQLGFKAVLMQDGRVAVDHFRKVWREIDLVIMDLVTPQLSGLDTFRALREINSEVPVVLSSGYSVEGEAQQVMDAGARAFLQKPYQISELSHLLAGIFTP